MKPEHVNPKNFKVESILFDNDNFSVAYGLWEDEEYRIAMRWNGKNDDPGYPKLFNNPVWFIIDDDLKVPILSSLMTIESVDKNELIKALQIEFQ